MSAWINQIWKAGQANQGNIVRRSIGSVMQYASATELENAVKAKGFHMVRIGDQFVILCDPTGQIEMIC